MAANGRNENAATLLVNPDRKELHYFFTLNHYQDISLHDIDI
jgi:hypothetical protein